MTGLSLGLEWIILDSRRSASGCLQQAWDSKRQQAPVLANMPLWIPPETRYAAVLGMRKPYKLSQERGSLVDKGSVVFIEEDPVMNPDAAGGQFIEVR